MDSFDPVSHIYRRDGIVVPSCTQILGHFFPPTAPQGRLEHARVRGDYVHHLIETHERDGDIEDADPLPEGLTHDEVRGRFAAYINFRSDVPIQKIQLEHWRIAEVDGYLYGVTPDIVGIIDGVPSVIECKNTYSAEVTHPIQTAAQVSSAPASIWGPGTWRRMALYLKPDGKYKLVRHNDLDDFRRWRIFLAAYSEMRRMK